MADSVKGKSKGKKGKGNIASFVRALVEPTVEALGYLLWDVEFVKEGAFYYLRFTIDSENGITIDDCEKVHRKIEPIIDEADPIEDFYYMEVSSPGIERAIRTDEHFAWAAERGEKLRLKLFTAVSGRKELCGRLLSVTEEDLLLDADGKTLTVPRSAVSKAALYYDYDGGETLPEEKESEGSPAEDEAPER